MDFFGVGDFGLSQLTSLQFIQFRFLSQTFLKVHPPICRITAYATMPGLVPCFEPNEWCLKNGLHSGGLNPGPLCHESPVLTTRPRLLACGIEM